MKIDEIKILSNILTDNLARLDEKDDAIICLGNLKDITAIDVLKKIATDNSQDYILKCSAGESIARIMIETNNFEKKYIQNLTDDAKNEVFSLLLSKKPEWKELIDALD